MPVPQDKSKSASEPKASGLRKPAAAAVSPTARGALPAATATTTLRGERSWRLRINAPFLFRHNRKNWDIEEVEGLEGVFWLPAIDRQPIVRGVGRIRTLRREEVNSPELAYEDEVMKAQKSGWQYLWPDDPPELGGGYALEVPAKDPMSEQVGVYYHDLFHELVPAPDESEPDKAVFNRVEYNKWRYNLVLDGVIAPPGAGIKSGAGRRAQKHHERADALNVQPAVRDRLIKRGEAEVAAVKSAKVPAAEAT